MSDVLVISSEHDEVTRTLDYYARCYVRDARSLRTFHLRGERPPRIHEVLRANRDAAMFLFLHGRLAPAGVVVGHREEEVIGKRTADLLRSRVICGTCYSLNGFADMAVARGGTVIGYDGEMFVPTKQRRAREMMEAALAAHHALKANETAGRAAESARDAYRNLADVWYNTQTIEGQVHAAVANANADAVGFKGAANTRMNKGNRSHVRTKK